MVSSEPKLLARRSLRLVKAHCFALHDAVYVHLAFELVIPSGGLEYERHMAAIEENKVIVRFNGSTGNADSI